MTSKKYFEKTKHSVIRISLIYNNNQETYFTEFIILADGNHM